MKVNSKPDGVALSVNNVGKMYPIYTKPTDRLKQSIFSTLSRFGRNHCPKFYREFWALHDLSFEVKRGDVLGIIGCNGAGKSTLLQIICGIVKPTNGEVYIAGRIAALLELGSGFDPEFTGRENVYLNGAILGFSQEQMDAYFDDIAAFADIGEFMDQAVKCYSSGMLVRLAFAVQACVQPDILVVDEALAVGDIFFRQKCYQYLEKLRQNGKTVILVSHNMSEITQFCNNTLLLSHGEAVFFGNASEAVRRYYQLEQEEHAASVLQPDPIPEATPKSLATSRDAHWWIAPSALLNIAHIPQVSNGWARCTQVAICNEQKQPCITFQQGETATFFYEFEILKNIEVPLGGLVICDVKGVTVHGKGSLHFDTKVPLRVPKGNFLRFKQHVVLDVGVAEYTFEVGLNTMSREDYENREQYSHSELHPRITRLCHLPNVGYFSVGFRKRFEGTQLGFQGVANLPGNLEVDMVNSNSDDRSESEC